MENADDGFIKRLDTTEGRISEPERLVGDLCTADPCPGPPWRCSVTCGLVIFRLLFGGWHLLFCDHSWVLLGQKHHAVLWEEIGGVLGCPTPVYAEHVNFY